MITIWALKASSTESFFPVCHEALPGSMSQRQEGGGEGKEEQNGQGWGGVGGGKGLARREDPSPFLWFWHQAKTIHAAFAAAGPFVYLCLCSGLCHFAKHINIIVGLNQITFVFLLFGNQLIMRYQEMSFKHCTFNGNVVDRTLDILDHVCFR